MVPQAPSDIRIRPFFTACLILVLDMKILQVDVYAWLIAYQIRGWDEKQGVRI